MPISWRWSRRGSGSDHRWKELGWAGDPVLETTLEENLAMIAESIMFLKSKGIRVLFDAEHYFDGYKANPGYALETAVAAEKAGAECVVLCDTQRRVAP